MSKTKYKSIYLAARILIFTVSIHYFIDLYTSQVNRFFWLDEAQTFDIINSHKFIDIINEARNQNGQPSLFYLLGKLWTLLSIKSQFLRLLPFIFFVTSYVLFIFALKRNVLFQFVLLIYYASSPFSHYVSFEFRPYSLSLCLFACIIVLNFGKAKLESENRIIVTSILILLASLTLSLNIPLSLFIFILILAIYFSHYRIGLRINYRFYLIIMILICFFINLLFISKYSNVNHNFNLSKYIMYLQGSFVILKDTFLNWTSIFILFFLFFSIRDLRKKTSAFFLVILSLTILYLIFFPPLILYNRISWYNSRYAHLLFLVIPSLLIILKNNAVISHKSLSYFQLIFLSLSLIIFYTFYRNSLIITPDFNHANSEWHSMLSSEKKCNFTNSKLVLEPYYIFTVLKFHVSIFPHQNIYDEDSILNADLSKVNCIYYASSGKLNEQLSFSNFKEKKTTIINKDWPQSLNEYKLFLREKNNE